VSVWNCYGKIPPRLLAAVVFYILSVFALYLLFNLGQGVQYVTLGGTEAVYDLTNFDFDRSIASAENRAYYYDKLLMPNEIDGYIPDDYGFAKQAETMTSRARFIVPEGDYMIFGKTPEYASRIYVNGELKASFGRIDEEKGNIYRIDTFEIAAHPSGGVIEVVTHSAAIIRRDASQYPVFFGKYQTAWFVILSSHIKNMVLLGIIISGAMFFLGFYIFLPHVRANLWFSLISLTFALQMAVSNKLVLKFFPNLDYHFTFITENGTLILISTLYLLLIRSLFGDGIPKLFMKIVLAVNALLFAALLCIPIRVTAPFLWIHITVFIAVLAVSAACILRVIKRRAGEVVSAARKPFYINAAHAAKNNEEQIISFAGQVLFLYLGISDMLLIISGIKIFPEFTSRVMSLYYESANLSVVGMLLFLLAQMLALLLHNNRVAENERRLAVENAVLAQANSAKTEFLANTSHEMKTPLTIISVNVQTAMEMLEDIGVTEKEPVTSTEVEDRGSPLEAGKLLQTAQSEIMRLARMVSGMLTLASMSESSGKEIVDFSALLTSSAEMLRLNLLKRGNMLTTDIEAGLRVFASADLLAQVVTNLLQNAGNHTTNGTIALRAETAGGIITVTVTDTGSGIPADLLPHVFERGVSDGSGTGFGLYLCKTIVESHGGRIWIESEHGRGTAAYFSLPVYEGQFGEAKE